MSLGNYSSPRCLNGPAWNSPFIDKALSTYSIAPYPQRSPKASINSRTNCVTNLNSPRETFKAKNARTFKSPRMMGNILSAQMEHNASESVAAKMGGKISPGASWRLLAPCGYDRPLLRLGAFTRTCREELIPAIKFENCENDRVCPINDLHADLFKFALYILEQAAEAEAAGVSAAQKKVLLAPLKSINAIWAYAVQEVKETKDGKWKISSRRVGQRMRAICMAGGRGWIGGRAGFGNA
ncbi:hypothetical protein CC86DRAFT_407362 [Ophiobolus disseminans]|uniref:Uncharacterized protein n=1 Tax=Ophiobolus disseminans TaxID=1469910 RepID=A0A6A6ZWN9_9PLEO|nr:hypothetical protein CC86DRAFT_407362 [Ophiobolus disseminans]